MIWTLFDLSKADFVSALKDGKRLQLETKDKDDIRVATVFFEDTRTFGSRFKIRFNGALIHSCKGVASLSNRLQQLVDKWNLEIIDYDEEKES